MDILDLPKEKPRPSSHEKRSLRRKIKYRHLRQEKKKPTKLPKALATRRATSKRKWKITPNGSSEEKKEGKLKKWEMCLWGKSD